MKRQIATIILALAMGGGLAAQAAFADSTTSPNPSDQPVTDTWITTKVKTELATTDGIKSGDISVTTKNGVVTLSGVVNAKAQVQKATAVAKSVKGVKDVDASALSSRD
jgi:hyperosmotically inducible periplasmic protein